VPADPAVRRPRAPGPTGKGSPYLKGVPGDAAAAADKTSTFLGERYCRLVRRGGKLKALVAIARALLVIIWHLLTSQSARYRVIGTDYCAASASSRLSATPSPSRPPPEPLPPALPDVRFRAMADAVFPVSSTSQALRLRCRPIAPEGGRTTRLVTFVATPV
jgi:hypothetical protein